MVVRGCQASHRQGLTSGEVWGTPGDFRGNLGSFRETSGLLLKIHSGRSSGEVAEELLGKFGELLGSPGTFQKLREA